MRSPSYEGNECSTHKARRIYDGAFLSSNVLPVNLFAIHSEILGFPALRFAHRIHPALKPDIRTHPRWFRQHIVSIQQAAVPAVSSLDLLGAVLYGSAADSSARECQPEDALQSEEGDMKPVSSLLSAVTVILTFSAVTTQGGPSRVPLGRHSAQATVATTAPARFARTEHPANQRSQAVQAPPTFRALANSVDVDVTVTDPRGQFVRDLRPGDFEVLEDGKLQRVLTFASVNLPYEVRPPTLSLSSKRIEPDIRSNASVSQGRVFVIVLDDLHTDPLRSARARDVARQFIERYVGPDDLVSVLHTGNRSDASQDFTSSSSLLLASIDRFMGAKLRSSILERLDAYHQQPENFGQGSRDGGGGTRADIRMQYVVDPLDMERGRQAVDMLETLKRLGTLLAQTRGRRKSVMLISEGLDYDLQSGIAQTSSGLSTYTSPYATSVMQRLREAIGAMTRANVAVYSIDPRGIATTSDEVIEVGALPDNQLLGLSPTAFQDELRQAQDSLRVLSDQTGGFAAVSSNDFSNAFQRIVQESSTYYLLGYQSDNSRTDGRFRKIEVRVKRPGVRIRSRLGYVAASSRNELTASTKPTASSEILGQLLDNALPVSGVPLRAFAAPFRGPGPSASVLVGLEIDTRTFRFGRKDGLFTNQLEAAVIAIDRHGTAHEGDRQSVQLQLRPNTYEAVLANGLRILFRLTVPPGRYQLRVAVHEAGAGAVGSVHYDVDVPDFNRDQLSLSGLVMTSAMAAAIPTPRPDPELAALLRYPPSGSREFTQADTLSAFFVVYHKPMNTVGSIDIITTIAADVGQVHMRKETNVPDLVLRGAPNGYGSIVAFPLTDLAPGAYLLRVQATSGSAEDGSALREVPFHIRAPETFPR